MRTIRCFLIAVITLSIMAGFSSIQVKETALAKPANSGTTLKAASDFTLKLPAGWKGNYIVKRSKKKKHGSYVAFYSKKCYNQTKEGWLFSIMRYRDATYQELPSYELVGKGNGYNYVAVYPTDVQCVGVTKSAQKQYMKLNKSTEKVARSIKLSK